MFLTESKGGPVTSHTRFHLPDLDALCREVDGLGLRLPIAEDLSILAREVTIGGRRVANRLAVQPMEGFDAALDEAPGELSFRRYERYAAGGSGLIWFEATAMLPEARSNPRQFMLHGGNADVFARLVDATRTAAQRAFGRDVLAVIQLTHSGRYSKPGGKPCPMIAHHSPVLDPKHQLPPDYPLVSDEYLDRLQDVYVEAAKLAGRAGFDGVDVKACHRYLVSELLASHTREGRYGGPLENRSRLLCEVVGRIRDAVPGLFVTTRINLYDALPHPFGFGVSRDDCRVPDLAEPIEVIRRLRGAGHSAGQRVGRRPALRSALWAALRSADRRREPARRTSAGRRRPADRPSPAGAASDARFAGGGGGLQLVAAPDALRGGGGDRLGLCHAGRPGPQRVCVSGCG